MNILIDASNLRKGGSLQVGLSFISELSKYRNYTFYVFLSKEIHSLVDFGKEYPNTFFILISINPTNSLLDFFKYNFKLKKLEKRIKPIFTITVFGPAYWNSKSLNITGFALGYYVNEESYFFEKYKLNNNFNYLFKKIIHRYFLKSSNYFWVETEVMKNKLSNFINIQRSSIIVSSNTCSDYFYNNNYEKLDINYNPAKYKLLYVSSYYLHKDFEIIPLVDVYLKKKNIFVQFIVTISQSDFEYVFKDSNVDIINLGSVHPKYCPYLYNICDLVFVPTLLETFSAVFPEAMKSEKPIITTEFDFIKDICRDSAMYYNPRYPEQAADLIKNVLENTTLKNKLIKNGKKILNNLDSCESRFFKILKYMEKKYENKYNHINIQ